MRKMKIIAIALCVIIITGVLAGCGSASIPKPTADAVLPTVDITGSCNIKVENTSITVSGETSFIPGTLVNVSVVAQSGMVLDSVDVTQTSSQKVETTFQIDQSKYDKNVKTITGFITVSPSKQPDDNVPKLYGEKFELISNDTIWNKDGNIVTFASDPYEF